MPRLFAIVIPLLVLAVLACNGDGGGKSTPSPSASSTPSATPVDTGTPETSVTPAGSPTATGSPTPTQAAEPTLEATVRPLQRVTPPEDVSAFFAQYTDAGKIITKQDCTLDTDSGQVDCEDKGLYEPDPKPPDDAVCTVLMVDRKPIAVDCTTGSPANVTYYEVK